MFWPTHSFVRASEGVCLASPLPGQVNSRNSLVQDAILASSGATASCSWRGYFLEEIRFRLSNTTLHFPKFFFETKYGISVIGTSTTRRSLTRGCRKIYAFFQIVVLNYGYNHK